MSIKYQKYAVLLAWFLVIANLFVGTPDWLDQTLTVLGIFLLVSHIIECVFFHRKIRANHRPAYRGFLMVMVFGVIHLNTLPDYSN